MVRIRRAIFLFETLLRNEYPKEWLALYLQGVNGAAVGRGKEWRLLNQLLVAQMARSFGHHLSIIVGAT